MKHALAAVCAAACGGSHPAAPIGSSAAPVATPPPGELATLVKVEPGDRACYVTLKKPTGEPVTMAGDFELCPGGAYDATGLVDKPIRFATRKDKIAAASCQGDPDCAASDVVDLVITIMPVE